MIGEDLVLLVETAIAETVLHHREDDLHRLLRRMIPKKWKVVETTQRWMMQSLLHPRTIVCLEAQLVRLLRRVQRVPDPTLWNNFNK